MFCRDDDDEHENSLFTVRLHKVYLVHSTACLLKILRVTHRCQRIFKTLASSTSHEAPKGM